NGFNRDLRPFEETIELFGHEWRQVHPVGSNRGPVSPEVPKPIAADYVEACQVLPLSAKASAALARRCLQAMLHAHGYRTSPKKFSSYWFGATFVPLLLITAPSGARFFVRREIASAYTTEM